VSGSFLSASNFQASKDSNPKIMNYLYLILVSLLCAGEANALNLGQFLSGMAAANQGYQQGYDRALQGRLLELQVEQANRMAVIQQLEYQRRIKELDEARQRELQRLQQLNVEALRREQAKIADIHAAEQARLAQARAAEQARPTQKQTEEQIRPANAQSEMMPHVNQKSVSAQLADIADRLRKSSPRSLNKAVSLIGASVQDSKLFLSIKLDTLNVKSDSYKKVNDELQNQIGGAVVTTCLDQTLEPLTRQGAVVRYSFFDSKQSFIEGVDTDKTDCVELYGYK
jgi:hypothetical protein